MPTDIFEMGLKGTHTVFPNPGRSNTSLKRQACELGKRDTSHCWLSWALPNEQQQAKELEKAAFIVPQRLFIHF